MMPTRSALIASVLLYSGCLPRQAVLPDRRIPHQVATPTTIEVWARRPDGELVRERVRVDEGWWIASTQVVEPNRSTPPARAPVSGPPDQPRQ